MHEGKNKWGAPALNVALLCLGWLVYGVLDFIGGLWRGDDQHGV